MNKMLLLAFVMSAPACGKKKEPETSVTKTEGLLDVTLKGDLQVERLSSDTSAVVDDISGWLNLENKGGMELSVTKVDYTVVTGDKRSEVKTWDHEPVIVAPGKTETIEVHYKMSWSGGGEFPYQEAGLDGNAYYTSSGAQKTQEFKLTGKVDKKQ